MSKLVPANKGRIDDSAANRTASHIRQQSGESVHSNTLDDKIHSEQFTAVDDAAERHRNVVEWVQKTGSDSIQQDVQNELPPFASPTFTDGSLSFSGLVGHQLTPKSAC